MVRLLRSLVALTVLGMANGVTHAQPSTSSRPTPRPSGMDDDTTSLNARVDAILASFSVDDLVGQMTQVNIGSFLTNEDLDDDKLLAFAKSRVGSYLDSPFSGGPRNGQYGYSVRQWRDVISRIQKVNMEQNGGHPILYGIDSVHGAIYVQDATIFGQQINAGASFNPALVQEMGRITAQDTLAAGIPWIFGPILEVSQNPLWPRTYETFGEDPYLVSVMGEAIIRGIQTDGKVAACMKHFIAYSKTPTGHDRAPVTISDFDLLNYFAPPFRAAIKANVKTLMNSYISINGVPVVASHKILTQLLRHDMGFDGLVVTDWGEIYNLYRHHRIVKNQLDAVGVSLAQTSLDMSMVPNETTFINHTMTFLDRRPEYLDRIKDSVRRILKTKLELGLYETPVPGAEYIDKVGSPADREVALQLARESIVLLKNDKNILPLPPTASIFLTGHSADNIGHFCGGWTLRWQGYSGNEMYPNGVSFKQGLESLAKNDKVTYFNGLEADGKYTEDALKKAKELAKEADYTIAVIGEATYAEKPGDLTDLSLPAGQIEYVLQLASTGAKVILVYAGGRPRLLRGLPVVAPAVINAMLPGPLGGQALAEIIYGLENPSGRMPITYPRDPANILVTYNSPVSELGADSGPIKAEWEFGHGLSYTTFEYSAVKLSTTTVKGQNDSITVSVDVTNTGNRRGKETVMLFVIQPYRLISITERKQLKKFEKIELEPGKTKSVTFKLTHEDWSVYRPQIGEGFLRWTEPGDFIVAIKPETDCDVYNWNGATFVNPLCASFEVLPEQQPEIQQTEVC